jgi:hypothetical protein
MMAVSAFALLCVIAPGARAGFGIVPETFLSQAINEDSSPDAQAASHPFALNTAFSFNTTLDSEGGVIQDGSPKDIDVQLPPGMVGDPTGIETCTQAQLFLVKCPVSSQVGVAHLTFINESGISPFPLNFAIYNMVPPPGIAAQFAFFAITTRVYMNAAVRTGSDYGVTVKIANVSQALSLASTSVSLWGVPADKSHDGERGACLGLLFPSGEECPAGVPRRPFLRLPSACSGPMTTRLLMTRWEEAEPRTQVEADYTSSDSEGDPLATEGCEALNFNPTISVKPDQSTASTPTGITVNVHVPQEASESPDGFGEADLKKAVVILPKGMAVNPSSAGGLGSCSAAQIEIDGPEPAHCPQASKLGTVEVSTPLLEDPLEGSVYLAKQGENKFGSLLAIYIAVDDPRSGVVVKLPGDVQADPQSGQLTATFDDNPQLPFEDLHVEFFDGPRAALTTPSGCGSYETTAEFVPWSGTAPVTRTSSFQITSGPNGGPCSSGAFDPKLSAGTTNPVGGSYSPFLLRVTREDGSERLAAIEATLPAGLLAKLKGVPYCPDSALASIPTAEGTGAAQLTSPACPASSQVGTVSVGAGAGTNPFYVNTGRAYLAGPYRGAPLSLAIVTPALAGPFDLGNVLVRSALRIDPVNARVTAVSDPLPQILDGIPLDLRDVRVNLEREAFTLNPTSCEPMAVVARITSTEGTSASPSDRFQVGSCERLKFAPKLSLGLAGETERAGNPRLVAHLKAGKGEANIARVSVALPHSEFLAQNHIRTVCTRVQFEADQCPAGSIYGYAEAKTPLLAEPLKGPVYLRANGGARELPDLVMALRGQIEIDLVGFIDSVNGGIRSRFNLVPDAPVTSFTLRMRGGKKSLLENSTDICRSTNKAAVKMDGQNGKSHNFNAVLRAGCGGKGGK